MALIFDLGNVLIFFSFQKMLEQIASCTGLSTEKVKTMLQTQGRLYETGFLSSEELYNIFQAASPKTFSSEAFFQAASDIFVPNEPMVPLVEELKKRHRLVLLSNTSRAHFEFLLPGYPVLQLFDETVLSYEVGVAKPHPKIYQKALLAAQCPPKECFYTDDIPEFVAAAKSQGIDSEVFTTAENFQKHLHRRRLL